jgi:hypothetical protein
VWRKLSAPSRSLRAPRNYWYSSDYPGRPSPAPPEPSHTNRQTWPTRTRSALLAPRDLPTPSLLAIPRRPQPSQMTAPAWPSPIDPTPVGPTPPRPGRPTRLAYPGRPSATLSARLAMSCLFDPSLATRLPNPIRANPTPPPSSPSDSPRPAQPTNPTPHLASPNDKPCRSTSVLPGPSHATIQAFPLPPSATLSARQANPPPPRQIQPSPSRPSRPPNPSRPWPPLPTTRPLPDRQAGPFRPPPRPSQATSRAVPGHLCPSPPD